MDTARQIGSNVEASAMRTKEADSWDVALWKIFSNEETDVPKSQNSTETEQSNENGWMYFLHTKASSGEEDDWNRDWGMSGMVGVQSTNLHEQQTSAL